MNQAMVRPMTGQPMMPIMAARPGMPPQAMAQMQPQAVAAVTAVQGQRGAANYKYGPNVRNPAQVTSVDIFFSLYKFTQPKYAVTTPETLETNFTCGISCKYVIFTSYK
jgi:hypothetical protein